MRSKIMLLVDYNGYFYSSAVRKIFSMDVELIKKIFVEQGFDVDVQSFCNVDFRNRDYTDTYILYTSQEDPDLKYKDFIEDIILGLQEKGGMLVPDFKYFRAHHNKVFMEILRDVSNKKSIQNIRSRYFGTKEDFDACGTDINFPAVIKPSAGATSKGVSLITEATVNKTVNKLSFSVTPIVFLKDIVKRMIRYPRIPLSYHRNKFVVQNYIPDLKGDFKVLVYDKKYYVLERKNIDNDFRASGSGKFSWPEEINTPLLDYAKEIFDFMDVPFLSLDIAEKDGSFFLIEFQVIMFGTYTLEKSSFYFEKENNVWKRIDKQSQLEEEFCSAMYTYLKSKDHG